MKSQASNPVVRDLFGKDDIFSTIADDFNYVVDGDFFLFDVKPILFPHSKAGNFDDLGKKTKQEKPLVDPMSFITCPTCKVSSWILRNTVGSMPVAWAMEQLVIALCEVILPMTLEWSSGNCPGIIHQQMGESIWPMLTQEVLQETNFCTFIFEVCDQDIWRAQDVKKVVYDIVNSKSSLAKQNNFVQNLYDEMA